MKNKLILILLLSITSFYSQDKLDKISVHSSPATSLLNIDPKVVLSPKSFQTLETAIFSNFINSGGVEIPNEFGLEFTPYWATNHGLSLKEFLFPQDIFHDQIVRNSSISLATTSNFRLGDSTSTNSISLGYRTRLFFGDNDDKKTITDYEKSIYTQDLFQAVIGSGIDDLIQNEGIKDKKTILLRIRNKLEIELRNAGIKQGLTETDIQILINTFWEKAEELPELGNNTDEFQASVSDLLDEVFNSKLLFEKFESYIQNRTGLSIDFAFGSTINFPSNNFEKAYAPQQALWLMPSYTINCFSFTGVYRKEWYNIEYYRRYFPLIKYFESTNNYGFSIIFDSKKIHCEFELVGRSSSSEIPAGIDAGGNQLYRKESDTDVQYIGTFSYRLTDDIILTYNIGNRFKPEINPSNTLVSVISLNFGFGTPTEKDISNKSGDSKE